MASTKPSPRLKPRGGDRRQRTFGGRPASSLWYGLAFLLLLVLVQAYYLTPAARTVPYSEFKDLIKQGAIEDVTVTNASSLSMLASAVSRPPPKQKGLLLVGDAVPVPEFGVSETIVGGAGTVQVPFCTQPLFRLLLPQAYK